jgi:DNA-binding MurR/RpiR family transcriptional regulator
MNYRELLKQVIEENRQVLEAVNPEDVERLVQEILRAKTIHLYGMGRMHFQSERLRCGLNTWESIPMLFMTQPVRG